MPEQTTDSPPASKNFGKKRISLIIFLAFLVVASVGVYLFSQKNSQKTPTQTKIESKEEPRQPVIGGLRVDYQVTGFISNIDTKNTTIEVKSFGEKTKTYQLKVNSKTTIYSMRSYLNKDQKENFKLSFKDLQKGYQIRVLTDKDPAQETSLISLVITVI